MFTLNELFELGMKRTINDLIPPGQLALNLGAGIQDIKGASNLDLPTWDAEVQDIPHGDNMVDTIYAFHFLEHFTGTRAIHILRDIQRVLASGGTANIVVPYYTSQMAHHDLDHKSFWCEETFRNLFSTPYYKKNREVEWQLRVNVAVIIGVVERNLALMVQLVKV